MGKCQVFGKFWQILGEKIVLGKTLQLPMVFWGEKL